MSHGGVAGASHVERACKANAVVQVVGRRNEARQIHALVIRQPVLGFMKRR
jgi:hypothetical protein